MDVTPEQPPEGKYNIRVEDEVVEWHVTINSEIEGGLKKILLLQKAPQNASQAVIHMHPNAALLAQSSQFRNGVDNTMAKPEGGERTTVNPA